MLRFGKYECFQSLTSRPIRLLSSAGIGDENNNRGTVDVDKLIGFFKQVDEKLAVDASKRVSENTTMSQTSISENVLVAESPPLLKKVRFHSVGLC